MIKTNHRRPFYCPKGDMNRSNHESVNNSV